MPDEQKPSLEACLAELEAIVKQLESGDLPIERAMALFERGTELSAGCRKQLEEAETRIEQLVRRGDRIVAEPMRVRDDS